MTTKLEISAQIICIEHCCVVVRTLDSYYDDCGFESWSAVLWWGRLRFFAHSWLVVRGVKGLAESRTTGIVFPAVTSMLVLWLKTYSWSSSVVNRSHHLVLMVGMLVNHICYVAWCFLLHKHIFVLYLHLLEAFTFFFLLCPRHLKEVFLFVDIHLNTALSTVYKCSALRYHLVFV